MVLYPGVVSKLSPPGLMQRAIGSLISTGFVTIGWIGLKFRSRPPVSQKVIAGDPLVSILIPTHNRANLLIDRSLRSALNQTHKDLEIIVCAHGCTDDTIEKVRAVEDVRVRLLEVPRTKLGYPEKAENHWLVGPVRPLNAGSKVARGQLIAILGDDDEWVPDHIERSVRELRRSGAEWVSSWSSDLDLHGNISTNKGSLERNEMVGPVATWVFVSDLKFAKWNIHSWRKGWNRPNDIDLAQRFLRMGVRHSQLQRVGAIWRPRPGENAVGVAAYINNPEEMLQHFSVKPDQRYST